MHDHHPRRQNNILERGQVPCPPGMCQMDSENYRRFLSIADVETREHKAPCLYLGLETAPGQYEPDPSHWPSFAQDNKTKAKVWYEWQHVSCNGVPHRVSCRADDLLHHGRHVPLNPLRACPTNLTFSIDWMEAVANNVLLGITYKGVVYEGDAQNFSLDLPNAGFDVQNKIVNWVLPDGRCMAWTVAELAHKRADELVDPSAREAYFAVIRG